MKLPTILSTILSTILAITIAQDIPTCTVDGIQCLNLHYTSADVGAVINCENGRYTPAAVCSPDELCIEEPTPHCGPKNSTGVAMGTIFPPTSTFAGVPSSTAVAKAEEEI
jgi:hypothetical protein